MCSKEELLEKELHGAYEAMDKMSGEHEQWTDSLLDHIMKLTDQKNKLKDENEYLGHEIGRLTQLDPTKDIQPSDLDDILEGNPPHSDD